MSTFFQSLLNEATKTKKAKNIDRVIQQAEDTKYAMEGELMAAKRALKQSTRNTKEVPFSATLAQRVAMADALKEQTAQVKAMQKEFDKIFPEGEVFEAPAEVSAEDSE